MSTRSPSSSRWSRAGGARLADLAQHLVLGRGDSGRAGWEARPAPRAPLLDGAQLGVQLLLALGGAAHLRDRLRRVLAGALQLADPLGRLVLLAARSSSSSGSTRAPALVQLQRLVERAGSAPRRASASRARCGSSPDLRRSSTGGPRGWRPGPTRSRPRRRFVPEYLREEVGDQLGVPAHHDVRRHDLAREAAVADREQHVVPALLADVEVRPVGDLAALELPRRPCCRRRWRRPASGSREQRSLKSTAPSWLAVSSFGDLDLAAAAAPGCASAAQADEVRQGGSRRRIVSRPRAAASPSAPPAGRPARLGCGNDEKDSAARAARPS